MLKSLPRYKIATAIAIVFHSVGMLGILFLQKDFFVNTTFLNLLLSFLLLVWTQQDKNKAFFLFMASVIVIGYFSEVVGVNSGLLFGRYKYGDVLGFKWLQVPLLIGINWFIIIYCSGMSIYTLLSKLTRRMATAHPLPSGRLVTLSMITDGATLAVFFDWLMEPVAIRLGFWSWYGNGQAPLYNYLSWFFISLVLMTVFRFCRFDKQNKFAINLLLIQAMFFLCLRTVLT